VKKIGITGGLGTGKSKVIEILEKLGSPVLSSDEIVHEEMKKGRKIYQMVVKNFGEGILTENGEINRSKLAEIIFNDKEKKEKLEGLIHPRVREEINNFFSRQLGEKKPPKSAFVEVPLLFEVGWEDLFDQVWVIWAPKDIVIKRLVKNGRFSPEDIEARLKSQMPLGEKVKKADKVIENKGSLWDLEKKVRERWKKLNGENSPNRPR